MRRPRLTSHPSALLIWAARCQDGTVSLDPIFIFDSGDLAVFPDLRSAEGWLEVYDLDRLRFCGADGTILKGQDGGLYGRA
jgi:hypothetical protein